MCEIAALDGCVVVVVVEAHDLEYARSRCSSKNHQRHNTRTNSGSGGMMLDGQNASNGFSPPRLADGTSSLLTGSRAQVGINSSATGGVVRRQICRWRRWGFWLADLSTASLGKLSLPTTTAR